MNLHFRGARHLGSASLLALVLVGAGCAPATTSIPREVPGTAGAGSETATNLTFTGTVRDATSGKPVPGVAINLRQVPVGTKSGVDGKYTITLPLASVYTASTAIDWFNAGDEMTFDPAGSHVVDFTVTPRKSQVWRTTNVPDAVYIKGETGLKVTVLESGTGTGLTSIGLLTNFAAVPGAATRRTGEGGSFTDREIPPGTYSFALMKFDPSGTYNTTDFPEIDDDYIITVVSGYTTEVTLTLAPR